jgi:hypothetical protein
VRNTDQALKLSSVKGIDAGVIFLLYGEVEYGFKLVVVLN